MPLKFFQHLRDCFLSLSDDNELSESEINDLSYASAREEVEALLEEKKCFEVVYCNSDNEKQGLGLFDKYYEIQAKHISLQISYLGRPDWLAEDQFRGYSVVGHTIENDYLFQKDGASTVYVFDIFEDESQEPLYVFSSIYHCILFYHRSGSKGSQMATTGATRKRKGGG